MSKQKNIIRFIASAVSMILMALVLLSFTSTVNATPNASGANASNSPTDVSGSIDQTIVDKEPDDLEPDDAKIIDPKTAVINKNLAEQEIVSLYQQINDKRVKIDSRTATVNKYQNQLSDQLPKLESNHEENMQTIFSALKTMQSDSDSQKVIENVFKIGLLLCNDMNAASDVANLQASLEEESILLKNDQEELRLLQIKLLQKKYEVCNLMAIIAANNQNAYEYINALNSAEADYSDAIVQAILDSPDNIHLISKELALQDMSMDAHVHDDGTIWASPCKYKRISSPFGYRRHPILRKWIMHNGVDLTNESKTPIRATRSGVVISAGWGSASGYYITIDHLDGTISQYMHLYKRPNVSCGDIVIVGDYIGGMGTTGMSTGVHLHFGIKKNNKYVNPMDYI